MMRSINDCLTYPHSSGADSTILVQFRCDTSRATHLMVLLLRCETLALYSRHVKHVGVRQGVLQRGESLLRDSALSHIAHYVIRHAEARRAHVAQFHVVQG